MRIQSTDPISMQDVPQPLDAHPFVVEGDGDSALKIYFESEDNKQIYLDIEVENPAKNFETSLDNPSGMGPGDHKHV